MQCKKVCASIKELQKELGSVPFSVSSVATDLALVEKHLSCELPVSRQCKESISEHPESIFRFSDDLIIMLSIVVLPASGTRHRSYRDLLVRYQSAGSMPLACPSISLALLCAVVTRLPRFTIDCRA